MATVYIPSLMQKLTDGQSKVEIEGATVRQLIAQLESQYPGMKERLVEETASRGTSPSQWMAKSRLWEC